MMHNSKKNKDGEEVFSKIEAMIVDQVQKHDAEFVVEYVNARYVAYFNNKKIILNEKNLPNNKADKLYIMLNQLAHVILENEGKYFRTMLESYMSPTNEDYLAVQIMEEIIGADEFKKVIGFKKSSAFKILEKLGNQKNLQQVPQKITL